MRKGIVMAESRLVLHCGARPVSEEELMHYHAPPPEGRWFPVDHSRVLTTVRTTLQDAGYEVRQQRLGLSKDGHRFFATLDLGTAVADGVCLAVGIRNSTDKKFPLGFAAGQKVFACDNLAFRSELLVKRKHTRFGEQRFNAAIAGAVTNLEHFRDEEARRIEWMKGTELSPEVADALILRAFERGIIGHHQLLPLIKEWREPRFEEFRPRTAWSLFNAATAVLRPRAEKHPHEFAVQTIRLNSLLTPPAN
jgi:hypothetical protein